MEPESGDRLHVEESTLVALVRNLDDAISSWCYADGARENTAAAAHVVFCIDRIAAQRDRFATLHRMALDQERQTIREAGGNTAHDRAIAGVGDSALAPNGEPVVLTEW